MLLQKIRNAYRQCKARLDGTGHHHHCWEIVVSKRELYLQMSFSAHQVNLLRLLLYGRNLPDYETCLLLVCSKFEFLGSLVFPVKKFETSKPRIEKYIHTLFEGFYETSGEVKDHLERICDESISAVAVKIIIQKLLFVACTCCACMADTSEIWWADSYRILLEYAVDHDYFPFFKFGSAEGIWQAVSKSLPAGGCSPRSILDCLPDSLRDQICTCSNKLSIRW